MRLWLCFFHLAQWAPFKRVVGLANMDLIPWKRQSNIELLEMVDKFDIESSMKTFGLYNSWEANERGMKH